MTTNDLLFDEPGIFWDTIIKSLHTNMSLDIQYQYQNSPNHKQNIKSTQIAWQFLRN